MSREDDARVAEILGIGTWYRESVSWDNRHDYSKQGDRNAILPEFTTDPSADYKVLEWVREQPDNIQGDYAIELQGVFGGAFDGYYDNYEPGWYSRALLVLKEKGLI